MSKQGFFRKAALEKLSTPEKLDQLIKITGLNAWLVLGLFALMLFSTVIWGFQGRVKTKINAMGVMLGGEVYDVASTSGGQLLDLQVSLGDIIEKNQVVAIINQPELNQQLELAYASLDERKYEFKQLSVFGSTGNIINADLIDKQKAEIELNIKTLEKNIAYNEQELITETKLLEKGLITKPQLVNRQQQIDGARNNLKGLEASLVELSSRKLNMNFDLKSKKTLLNQRITQEKLRIAQLEDVLDKKTKIRSPHAGKVVEVLTKNGTVINPGYPLFKIKSGVNGSGKIKGVLYVPTNDGKKLKEGMQALVVPSTVQPQEYGYIKGTVTYVSEFPVTHQGLQNSIQNDQIANSILSMGAPFEIFVEFEEDQSTPSGFAWTSAVGPDVVINAGTSCLGKVTVKEEPPIAMIIPAFKDFFDLY